MPGTDSPLLQWVVEPVRNAWAAASIWGSNFEFPLSLETFFVYILSAAIYLHLQLFHFTWHLHMFEMEKKMSGVSSVQLFNGNQLCIYMKYSNCRFSFSLLCRVISLRERTVFYSSVFLFVEQMNFSPMSSFYSCHFLVLLNFAGC